MCPCHLLLCGLGPGLSAIGALEACCQVRSSDAGACSRRWQSKGSLPSSTAQEEHTRHAHRVRCAYQTNNAILPSAGILRVMILSQLAPQRLTIAPEAPMPLSGLLEEVAAATAASDGQSLRGPQSVTDGSEDGSGLKVREPSISAAAQPAELGWEELPSVLTVDLDAEGGMKEVGSLQVGGAEHPVSHLLLPLCLC